MFADTKSATRSAVGSSGASSEGSSLMLFLLPFTGEKVAQVGVARDLVRDLGSTSPRPTFGGADRDGQRRRGLVNRHPLHVAKHKRHAFVGGEGVEDAIAALQGVARLGIG